MDHANNNKTSRLCVLMEPQMKRALDALCSRLDTTASQVVRRLVRGFLEAQGVPVERTRRRR